LHKLLTVICIFYLFAISAQLQKPGISQISILLLFSLKTVEVERKTNVKI